MPGAIVEIAGPATQQQTTDVDGEAHFLNLAPGNYVVTVTLQGFTTYRNDAVRVASAASVPLRATLQVAGVAETVQVNVEAPIVDPARQTVTTGVRTRSCSSCPRRAIRGSSCRPSPASSSTASTSVEPNRASSRTTWRRARDSPRTPGTSTASR